MRRLTSVAENLPLLAGGNGVASFRNNLPFNQSSAMNPIVIAIERCFRIEGRGTITEMRHDNAHFSDFERALRLRHMREWKQLLFSPRPARRLLSVLAGCPTASLTVPGHLLIPIVFRFVDRLGRCYLAPNIRASARSWRLIVQFPCQDAA